MDSLKIKFKLHGLEFELEGKEQVVKDEFENFKTFITSQLIPKVNFTEQINPASGNQGSKLIPTTQEVISLTETDYPTLKEVVKRDLPNSEVDWVLIYCFYASGFAENTFTEKDIRGFYESTGRKNTNRLSNLSKNITSLLNRGYIKMHNDTEYLIKETGTEYATKILEGNSTSKTTKGNKAHKRNETNVAKNDKEENSGTGKTKKKTKASGNVIKKTPAKSVEVIEFDIFKTPQKISLEALFEKKKPGTSTWDRILLIAYYIMEINKQQYFTEGHIEYAFKALGLKDRPNYLRQTINNIKNGKMWFKDHENGWTLTRLGELYIDKLPRNGE